LHCAEDQNSLALSNLIQQGYLCRSIGGTNVDCVRLLTISEDDSLVPWPRPQHSGSRAGFTLVELLAVVGIIGSVVAMGIPASQYAVQRARVARAIVELRAISKNLDLQDSLPDALPLPVTRDPWGNPYQYNKFPDFKKVPKGARRDRFLVPINTTYDLYTIGRDGKTSPALTAGTSQDDVIRANDGGFFGLASKY
jgi:general secretion pathway protein G